LAFIRGAVAVVLLFFVLPRLLFGVELSYGVE
jgi:hypothetical protein